MGDLQDPKMGWYVRTIFLAIFRWDIPRKPGLKNRSYAWQVPPMQVPEMAIKNGTNQDPTIAITFFWGGAGLPTHIDHCFEIF